MVNPVKTAKKMFDQFLSKHAPDAADSLPLIPAPKAAATRALASKVGAARAAILTPQKRRKIAKQAAKTRWEKR
jgi:hypothetical protein